MVSGFDSVSIFTGLSATTLDDISGFCSEKVFSDGETLIEENDLTGNDLYVLRNGNIEILSNGSGITSDDISLSRHDKDVFGEIAWLSGRKRTATIRCLGEVEAVRVDGDRLNDYLRDHPDAGLIIMRNIAVLLATRLDQTNNLLKQVLWNSHI